MSSAVLSPQSPDVPLVRIEIGRLVPKLCCPHHCHRLHNPTPQTIVVNKGDSVNVSTRVVFFLGVQFAPDRINASYRY